MATEMRLQSKLGDEALKQMIGKIIDPSEVDVLLTGPATIRRPDGKLLLKYLPRAFSAEFMDEYYGTLHELRDLQTGNRGMAGGTPLVKPFEGATRQYGQMISSGIIGAFDAQPPKMYCRLTAWSGKEWDKYSSLFPLFRAISDKFAENVPDRWGNQMSKVKETHPDWVIPGTAFTTITVNNSYPTGVHTDKGDLDEGFSTLTVLRRGKYVGGWLTFPEFRVAVDMKDGDLLLMDAHQWHGNTPMICMVCRKQMGQPREDSKAAPTKIPQAFHDNCGTERISIVSYFRTKMTACGSAEEEAARAVEWSEKGNNVIEEMAVEAVGG